MIRKKAFTLAFTMFFALLTCKVKAAGFTDGQIVDSNKTWKITFNHEIVLDDATKNDIIVTDSNGNSISVSLEPGQDNQTIVVNPPEGGYKPGQKYSLNIGNNVHNEKLNLKLPVKMNFSIKQNTVSYKIGDSIKIPYSSSTYKIIDLKQGDINGDSKPEAIILGAIPDEYDYYTSMCLIVLDNDSGQYKSYTTFEYNRGTINTANINLSDYNNDGISDVRLNMPSGGNYGYSGCAIYSDINDNLQLMDRTNFNGTNEEQNIFSLEVLKNHFMKISSTFNDSAYTVDLSSDSDCMNFVKEGNTIEPYIGYGPNYKEIKGSDGSNLLEESVLLSGTYHSDTVAQVNTIYKYDNSQQKFVPIQQNVTSDYTCTKIQDNYLYTSDYLNSNAQIEVKVDNIYCDESGKKYIHGHCFKMLNTDGAIDYIRHTGKDIDYLSFDSDGNPSLDDDYYDAQTSDEFALPVSNDVQAYAIDFNNFPNEKLVDLYDLPAYTTPYSVTIQNGMVIKLEQEYRP